MFFLPGSHLLSIKNNDNPQSFGRIEPLATPQLTPAQLRDVVFVAIDFENLDKIELHPTCNFRSETGISILDTRNLEKKEHSDHFNLQSQITTHHFATRSGQGGGRPFQFGISKIISQLDIRLHIESVLPRHPEDRNIILVGHSIMNEFTVLRRLRFDLQSSIIGYLDTQLIAAKIMAPNMSLHLLMETLGSYFGGYHNAGNDAYFTLLALTKLAVKIMRYSDDTLDHHINNPSPLSELLDLAKVHTRPIPHAPGSEHALHWSEYYDLGKPLHFEEGLLSLPRILPGPWLPDPWFELRDFAPGIKRLRSISKPGYLPTQMIDPELRVLAQSIEDASTKEVQLQQAIEAYEVFETGTRKRRRLTEAKHLSPELRGSVLEKRLEIRATRLKEYDKRIGAEIQRRMQKRLDGLVERLNNKIREDWERRGKRQGELPLEARYLGASMDVFAWEDGVS